jgi:glutathione S-transferase
MVDPATNDLIFYTNPMSRGRLVRWMLEEVGCPYRTEVVDYGPPMNTADYLAVNPMGKVPAIRHGTQVVTECAAICAYLADAFPAARLAPAPAERGSYYRWLFFAAGPVEAAVTAHAMKAEPQDERQDAMAGYGSFARVMDTLEKSVPAEGYIAGPRFTTADLYLGAHIGWGLQWGTIEKRPGFEDYWARCSDRDAYRRAKELDDAAMPKEA